MNTQHTLMMLAASVGPLCMAQTPTAPATPVAAQPAAMTAAAEPSPLAGLIAEVSKPTPPVVKTPEQRIAVLPDLALMPQDVDSFVVLPDIAALEKRFGTTGKKCPLKSLALGYSKGAEQMAGTMGELVALFLNARMLLRAEVEWETTAGTPEIQRGMHASMVAYRKATLQRISEELRTQGNGPIYAVATLTPEAKLEAMGLKPMLMEICDAYPDEFQYLEQGELFGMRHIPKENIGPVPKAVAGGQPELDAEEAALEKELRALPMTVMFLHAGDQLLAAACAQPEEVRVAGSIAESLLNTGKVAALDSRLESGLVLGAHLSPTMQQALSKIGFAGTQYVLGMAQAVFKNLAEQPGDFKTIFTQAAQGAQTLHPLTRWGLPSQFKQAADLTVWMDDHLHVELSHDADELVFEPGTLALVSLGSMPEQALYFESTPSKARETSAFNQNLSAFEDIIRGYVCTGTPGQAAFTLSLYDALRSRFEPVTQALGAMKSSLNTNFSMIASSGDTPESLRQLMGPVMPIVAYRVGVKDRAGLQQAWDQVLSGTRSILSGMLPPETMLMPKFMEATCPAGGTSYTLDMAGINTTFSPGMVLTDQCLVLGSSGVMNCLVSQAQMDAPMFTGMVFALHFKPMARMAQSLAEQTEQNLKRRFPMPPKPCLLTTMIAVGEMTEGCDHCDAAGSAAVNSEAPGSEDADAGTEAEAPVAAEAASSAVNAASSSTAQQTADDASGDSAGVIVLEQSDNAALVRSYLEGQRLLKRISKQAERLEKLSRWCSGIYGANCVQNGRATLRIDAMLIKQ